ncbi:hypothetical protein JCM8097_000413 [Rhodosporidiobolus ruineniae]
MLLLSLPIILLLYIALLGSAIASPLRLDPRQTPAPSPSPSDNLSTVDFGTSQLAYLSNLRYTCPDVLLYITSPYPPFELSILTPPSSDSSSSSSSAALFPPARVVGNYTDSGAGAWEVDLPVRYRFKLRIEDAAGNRQTSEEMTVVAGDATACESTGVRDPATETTTRPASQTWTAATVPDAAFTGSTATTADGSAGTTHQNFWQRWDDAQRGVFVVLVLGGSVAALLLLCSLSSCARKQQT